MSHALRLGSCRERLNVARGGAQLMEFRAPCFFRFVLNLSGIRSGSLLI